MKEKILLADDVEVLAQAVAAVLKRNNYDVDVVYDGKQALEKATSNLYDCIVLDIMMPIINGIDVVKQLRKLDINVPIILLTAKGMIEDKVIGLDSGANDYLCKPFDTKELLARIRALTRDKKEQVEQYKIGDIVFNKKISEISKDQITMHLNNKECEVMEFLIKNKERNVSAEELKQKIWANENNDFVVPMYINYLQEKLFALNTKVYIFDENQFYRIFDN